MGKHRVFVHWERNAQNFNYETYDRTYAIKLCSSGKPACLAYH
jgi:hypothetical protein